MGAVLFITIALMIYGYSFFTVMSWWLYLVIAIILGFFIFLVLGIIVGLYKSFND